MNDEYLLDIPSTVQEISIKRWLATSNVQRSIRVATRTFLVGSLASNKL